MKQARGVWALVTACSLLGCGAPSTAKSTQPIEGGQRRVVVPCEPNLTLFTADVCQKACPAPAAREQLITCEDAPSSELMRDRLAPMARALVLCRYEVKR